MDREQVEAYEQALALLRRCLTPSGFVASPVEIDNYARVWARDGIITGLAALASGQPELVEGMEKTLDTLQARQGPHGEIPSNVSVDGSQVSYGRLSGRVDALLWYVIGVCAYLDHTGRASLKVRYWLSVERALFLAGSWEYNNRGLLYTPQAGDWADEYVQQGYVLYDLLLYERALSSAGLMFNNKDWQKKALDLRALLVVNYWPRQELVESPLVYHTHAYRAQVERDGVSHWLAALSPSGYSTYFDGFAHALALIADIGDNEQKRLAEAYVRSLEQETGSALLPAFWPAIQPSDALWPQLQENHLYGAFKNQPYTYHNGGLWPMLTGFYIVGLVQQGWRERALHLLAALDAANALGRDGRQWEFAEFHHGQTHIPMGTHFVAWSAAATVLAHQALWREQVPWPLRS